MNEFTEQLQIIFNFTTIEIILLSLLVLILIVQIIYYFGYYCIPLSYAKKYKEKYNTEDTFVNFTQYPKVSIIVESENEMENLKELLVLLLSQDYPDYEVIVINNGSTDETDLLLENLKKEHPNLYKTYLSHSGDNGFEFRKLALTLGVKAAKGDIVLFTETYCRPISDQWVRSMVKPILTEEGKEIVLGYSYYNEKKCLLDHVISFDNLIFGLQYLSSTIKGKPYTGCFRNLAFKKHLFYDNKGFASHLYLDNSEEVFINKIATGDNTTVCIEQESFINIKYERYSRWKKIKKSYSVARSCFKGNIANFFSVELFSRFLFYGLFLSLLFINIINENWGIVGVTSFIFVIRETFQLIILNKAGKYFKTGQFYLLLPFLDMIQPIYNMVFKTRPRNVIR